MKNYTVRNIAFLFILTTVLSSWSAEPNFIKDLQARLIAYYKQSNPAKIHVILNQPKYVAGDTAFFKVHLLSAQDLSPVEDKHIINISVIGKDGKPILFNRIVSEDGTGRGQFILPENIVPGNYLIVAYSDEMKKTVASSLFYQSSLTIAGPKEFVKSEEKYLGAFPEGGNLVAGQKNRVVVQASKTDTKATILNSSGKIIEELLINKTGFGDVVLTPIAGEKYYVESNGLKKELPTVVEDGIALHAVQDKADESILVTLQVPSNSAWRSGQLYLVMNMQSKIYFSTSVLFKKDTLVSISIPLKNCPSGVAQLTVFSSKTEVLSERLFYVDQADPVTATITSDTLHYKIRKPVKVSVAVTDSRNNALQSNLSLSVYREDLFLKQNYQSSFLSNITLHSDLGYGNNIIWDKMSEEDKDIFLITQRWKKFQWKDIVLQNNAIQSSDNSMPFYFKGKIISAERKSIPDSTTITFYLNNRNFAYEVYTRRDGEFEFPLFTNFGDDEVFYSVRYEDEFLYDAQVLLAYDSLNPQIPFSSVSGTSSDAYFAFSKLKNQVVNSFQYYLDKNKPEEAIQVTKEKNSILNPDFSVNLDKYASFSSMADILNEIVPLVRYSKINGKGVVRIFLDETETFSRKSPLYIIDGVMTDSTAFFLNLNPSYVSHIDILKSRSKLVRFGSLGKNGIIIVETKIPGHAKSIPRTKRSFNVTGLSSSLVFKPSYHGEGDAQHTPDIRSALYWNPELKTSDDGTIEVEFYTNDGTGNYIMRVEGITEDGRPFVNESRFKVSFK